MKSKEIANKYIFGQCKAFLFPDCDGEVVLCTHCLKPFAN